MKTLDEALAMVLHEIPLDGQSDHQLDGECQDFIRSVESELARRSDAVQEIYTHPKVRLLVEGLIESISEEDRCKEGAVFRLALTAFVNGVMLGMDMERSDHGIRTEPGEGNT